MCETAAYGEPRIAYVTAKKIQMLVQQRLGYCLGISLQIKSISYVQFSPRSVGLSGCQKSSVEHCESAYSWVIRHRTCVQVV
jgi:hypothetical protein